MRKPGAMLLLGLLALPPPAMAQAGGPQDSARCQQRCGAVLPRRIDNTREVQICLYRCEALERLQPAAPGRAASAAGAAPAAGTARFGAIYLAPPPATGFGLALGQPDRAAAHRAADQQCRGRDGPACRPALEPRDRCGAVAQGVQPKGMVLTADPSTFTVMAAAPGSGATQPAAEADALATCRQRFRGTCRVVASRCG